MASLKEGYGVYKWADATYEGKWRRNVPSGSGRYAWRVLRGRLPLRHGADMYTFADGAAFVGAFRDGPPAHLSRRVRLHS